MDLLASTWVVVQLLGIALILTLPASATDEAGRSLALSSPAFENGSIIPERYTCSGQNESPPLKWAGIPRAARSLALILDDPDAPLGPFVHWVIYDFSASTLGLPAGGPPSGAPGNGERGLNGGNTIGYTGPCPPPGQPHHYHFRLYALDHPLDLKAGATAQQVEMAMKGHLLGSTELVGIFQR